MDRNLNELLKWSIENTNTDGNRATITNGDASTANDTNGVTSPPSRGLSAEAIRALMGGPSEADLMRAAMEMVTSEDPDITLDAKMIAFDNFEQLVESLDNANNISALSLWTPLLGQLSSPEPDLRRMAAWCIGTAVQNNLPSQERLLAMGGVAMLVDVATKQGEEREVRRKAVYALSSACRNYQPAMDACTDALARQGREQGKVDAVNMDAMDEVMNKLKEEASQTAA